MTIGQDILPGIVTDIESLPAVSVGGLSGANVLLVGPGNLDDGEAEPNEAYTVTRSSQVRSYFGEGSILTEAIQDALNEGALPVYAIATEEESHTETVDTSTGTLDNAPTSEDAEDYNVNGYNVKIVMEAADEVVVGENEVVINPVFGEYAFDTTPNSVEVEYTSYDYNSAFDTVEDDIPDEIDYIYSLSENPDVRDRLEGAVNALEQYKIFTIGGIGYSPHLADVTTAEAPVDNSRMQIFYPSRNEDGKSIIGAIGGEKASQGINGSTMNKRLSTHTRLIDRISESDQIHLIGEQIVPVASESRGALLVDDPTCVDPDNADESNMADGYSRLIVDRVAEIVHDTERPYIGKLNKAAVRGSLQASIRTGLDFLYEQDAIVDYHVRVYQGDAVSAFVDVGVETTKPLRNVYNTISVGDAE